MVDLVMAAAHASRLRDGRDALATNIRADLRNGVRHTPAQLADFRERGARWLVEAKDYERQIREATCQ
jgi:hypothetical protein